jgi:hypothetical protein
MSVRYLNGLLMFDKGEAVAVHSVFIECCPMLQMKQGTLETGR